MTKAELIQLLVTELEIPEDRLKTILADYPEDGDIVITRPRVESREEAFALFEEYRQAALVVFRKTAETMLQTRDWVAARQVINQMKADGTYVDFGGDWWTGAAFTGDDRFEQCGSVLLQGESYEDARAAGRRAHGSYRVSKWRLRQTNATPVEEVLQLV